MKMKLRIIQVVNVRWFNATAWYALFLARLLKAAGHDVLVLGLEGTASFRKAQEWGLEPRALDLNAKNPLAVFRLHAELDALVRSFAPHVVNCHRGENFFLWPLLRRSHPFALVRTRGDQRPPRAGMVNRLLHSRLCDMLVATNSVTQFDLTRRLRCPEEQVAMLPGGVDTSVFVYDEEGRKRVRQEFGFDDTTFVLGFLGRFDPVKGIHELIRAASVLVHHTDAVQRGGWSDFRLLLAGFPEGISLEEVQAALAAANLTEKAVVTGKRADVAAVISAMDAGGVTSVGSEAIARAALEIMSCGVPLFSSRIGVMPDLLPEWAMYPADDTEAFVALLAQVVGSEAFRHRLKEVCLCRIDTLSEKDFLRQTEAVYEAAIRRRGLPIE